MTHNFDEYEVEFASQYSGSYTDDIMFGDIENQNTGRIRVAGHSGDASALLIMFSSGGPTFNQSFYNAFKKNRICGFNYKYSTSYCNDEIFYDSLVPDPVAVYNLNGGKLVFSNMEDHEFVGYSPNSVVNGKPTWDVTSSNDLFFNIETNAKFILSFSDIPVTSSETSDQVSDNTWLSTFPFQQRYSNIKRLTTNPYISTIVTGNEYMSRSSNVPIEMRYVSNTNPLITLTASGIARPGLNAINSNGSFISNPSEISIEFISFSSSGDSATTTKFHRTAYETLGQISGSSLSFSESLTYSATGLTSYKNNFASFTGNSFIKTFYGFGNGFRKTPSFDAITNNHSGSSFYYRCASPVIRGWKYGLYNGSPTKTKILFRRNKFGQFRDMLEQRPFTKFFDGTALASPISIKFVSGSNSAITASNSSLNTRESGQYNNEYLSGLPFFEDR